MTKDLINKYGTQIKQFLNVDNAGFEALSLEFERTEKLSLLMRHPFLFYGILSLIMEPLYMLYSLKRKVLLSNEDFVFISCPDPIFRTKNINLLAGQLSFCVVYLPNFHIKEAIRYNRYFKTISVRSFYPTIKLKDVISARRKINVFLQDKKVNLDKMDYGKMISMLSNYLIFDGVVKRFLQENREFRGKWLLEHQIYYFVPVVTNLRSIGKESIMLQHGLFFKPTTDFFPLHCDKVLCCSEREKEIYLREGVEKERVKVLGIPLQTMNQNEVEGKCKIEYDLLLLLTFVDNKNVHLIGEVLDFVRQYVDKVLIRFRPRSKENDKKLLENHIKNFAISDSKHSINQDIARSEKVITFSADAIVEVVKCNKPFLYFWLKENQDFLQKFQCATMDNYKDMILSFMEASSYSSTMIEMSNYVVGEQLLDVISNRFCSYIKS